jgi:methylmalonyl-CoA mutase cobalamin-binding domain/chain
VAAKSAAIATHAAAQAAATDLLRAGNAVDAVVGAVLAVAAAEASVLLGPLSVLVAGRGAGARAFDGRVRQPGKGAPRPRGFKDGESIPDAARVGATVGEMSLALEKVFGRHQAVIRAVRGVYAAGMTHVASAENARRMVEAFLSREGRRPRILLAKMGQDGHDRGQKVVASAFSDLGFDVDIGPLFQTPEETAQQAADNDVHVVGVSSLAAGHLTLVPALRAALDALGKKGALIVVGGVIPPQDYAALEAAGAAMIFGPGTVISESAVKLLEKLEQG